MTVRPFPISISVTEPFLVLLDSLAEARRLSRSALVRALVKAEAERAGESDQEVKDNGATEKGAC